jgi:hypothetical protein
MHSFLQRMPNGAKDFIDVQTLETSPEVGVEAVRAAVGHLLTMPEPLRYRFPRNGLGTRIECGEVDPARLVDTKVLPPLPIEEEPHPGRADRPAHQSLRVRQHAHGRAPGRPRHAAADLLAGRSPTVAPRPPRWREWSEHLRDMASSDELAAELTYWTATLRAGAASGTLDGTGNRDILLETNGTYSNLFQVPYRNKPFPSGAKNAPTHPHPPSAWPWRPATACAHSTPESSTATACTRPTSPVT